MKLIKKSKKLNNVLYDIRGPIVDRAKEMEAQGQQLIKLNIGNLASFDFQVPEEIQRDMILNLPNSAGYSDSKGIFAARKAVMHYTQELGIRGVTLDDIYLGNGASDLISLATNALLDEGDELLIPMPDYPLWTATTSLSGGTPVHYLCDEENGWQPDLDDIRAKITPRTRGIVIINPNNPTGRLIADDLLEEILRICREKNIALFVDECFLSLSDGGVDLTPSLSDFPQLFILKAFTKSFGMAGLRLGYGLSADEALLRKMSAAVPPWNVSTLAQAAGVAALGDVEFLEKNRTIIRAERPWLEEKLRKFGFWVCPSQVNYILFRGDVGLTEQLRARGVAIRDCANFEGLTSGWYRVAVRQYEENEQLIAAIRSVGKE